MTHKMSTWTLSEAARGLTIDQHRLIYLCEAKVIIPDIEEAHGRGSSRIFSERNLLEFALALTLQTLALPISTIVVLVRLLRAAERTLAQQLPGFHLPDSLRGPTPVDMRLIIRDGRVFATARQHGTLLLTFEENAPLYQLAATGVVPPLFQRTNLRRLIRWVASLQDAQDPLSTYLRQRIPPDTTRALLTKNLAGQSQTSLVQTLNETLLLDSHLLNQERFPATALPPTAYQRLAANYTGDRVIFVNRYLLHVVYRHTLGSSRKSREWGELIFNEPTVPHRSRLLRPTTIAALPNTSNNQFVVQTEIQITTLAQTLPV